MKFLTNICGEHIKKNANHRFFPKHSLVHKCLKLLDQDKYVSGACCYFCGMRLVSLLWYIAVGQNSLISLHSVHIRLEIFIGRTSQCPGWMSHIFKSKKIGLVLKFNFCRIKLHECHYQTLILGGFWKNTHMNLGFWTNIVPLFVYKFMFFLIFSFSCTFNLLFVMYI